MGAVEARAHAWLFRAVVLVWAAELLPWGVVLAAEGADRPPVAVVTGYAGYLGWAVVLMWRAGRHRRVHPRWLVAAVLVMLGCELLVGLASIPGTVTTWRNWTPPPATGVAVLAQVYGGWRWAAGAAAILSAGYVATGLRDAGTSPVPIGPLVGNTAQLVVFTAAAGLVATQLIATARRADREAEAALRATEAEARSQERVRQYDLLHTNVLTTLTLLARGPDTLSPRMRERCAQDAKYLRSVVHSVTEAAPQGLNTALAEAIFNQSRYGLNIHYSSDALPADTPEPAVDAIRHAVMEALNNVAKHAATTEVWVVATGEPDGEVVVTVTDQGAGFDHDTVRHGTGLSRSIRDRMAEVGGEASVHSQPGSGTSVEIRWRGGEAGR
jgi:signal transduction histidine kinase